MSESLNMPNTFFDNLPPVAGAFPISKIEPGSVAVTIDDLFVTTCIDLAKELEFKATEVVVSDAATAQSAAAFVGMVKATQKRSKCIFSEPKDALNAVR